MANNIPLQNIQRIKREINRSLKKVFSGQITLNFMLEIMYEMLEAFPNLSSYVSIPTNLEDILKGEAQHLPYILCQHIIGVHKSKIIFLSNEERFALEHDDKYKKELMDDVYKMVKLRGEIDRLIRNLPLTKGDNFLLFPLPYYIAVLDTKFLLLSQRSKIMPSTYIQIANKTLAILSLLQDNFLDCAYLPSRTLIEEYFRALIFKNCPKAYHEYAKFVDYELRYSINHKFADEFKRGFDNRANKKERSKINYLHYGWVDKLPNYHKIIESRPYTFAGLYKYCFKKLSDSESKNILKLLNYYHGMCNGYVHGSINNSKYPLLHYFEISSILALTTFNAYTALCNELNEPTSIQGIDLESEINKHYKILYEAESKKSTENFEIYYK